VKQSFLKRDWSRIDDARQDLAVPFQFDGHVNPVVGSRTIVASPEATQRIWSLLRQRRYQHVTGPNHQPRHVNNFESHLPPRPSNCAMLTLSLILAKSFLSRSKRVIRRETGSQRSQIRMRFAHYFQKIPTNPASPVLRGSVAGCKLRRVTEERWQKLKN